MDGLIGLGLPEWLYYVLLGLNYFFVGCLIFGFVAKFHEDVRRKDKEGDAGVIFVWPFYLLFKLGGWAAGVLIEKVKGAQPEVMTPEEPESLSVRRASAREAERIAGMLQRGASSDVYAAVNSLGALADKLRKDC